MSYTGSGLSPFSKCVTDANGECVVYAYPGTGVTVQVESEGELSASASGTATLEGSEMTIKLTGSLPKITKLSLKKGPAAGGTSVTISGTGFKNVKGVTFGTGSAVFTVNSATSITVVSPASTSGIVDVRVTTSLGLSAVTSKDEFKYERPTISGISPATAPKSGGTVVTVTGSGFALGTTATSFKFGKGVGSAVNCSSTTVCAVVAPAGKREAVDVVATVGEVKSQKVAADEFTYE